MPQGGIPIPPAELVVGPLGGELEKKKALDIPVVVYDSETQTIYHENTDGSRVEIGKRMWKERYSERIAKKA